MTIIRDIDEISDKFYNNFLLRDLVYIISGLLIILSVILPIDNLYPEIIDSTWLIVLLIFFSYYIGLINQEFWVWTGIIKMYPPGKNKFNIDVCLFKKICGEKAISKRGQTFVEQEKKSVILSMSAKNSGKIHEEALKKLERIKVIKNSTSSFGSALITTIIILCVLRLLHKLSNPIECNFWYLIVVMSLLTLGAIVCNWRKASVQEKIESEVKQCINKKSCKVNNTYK